MSSTAEVYERAVIGAVMKDPWQAVQLHGWLNAGDFSDWWNREIYQALVDERMYQHPLVVNQPPANKPAVLAQMLYARLQNVAVAQGWQLATQDWQQVWQNLVDLPRNAPYAAHAADYGNVVARASFDRTIGQRGEHAEQAVIAALLRRPDQAQQLRSWLKSEDFQDPALGSMYRSLVEVESLCTHVNVVRAPESERRQVLAQMLVEDLAYKAYSSHPDTFTEQQWSQGLTQVQAMVGDLAWGQDLPHPEQAAWMGQRVLQSNIQRTVAYTFDDWQRNSVLYPDRSQVKVDMMLREVEQLEARWNQAMGGTRAAAQPFPPRVPDRATAATEDMVLGSLVQDHSQIKQVRNWLRPEDFTAPGRATLYRTILQTADAGRTLDPILLAWHAQQNGLAPTDLRAEEIWAIAEHGVPGQAVAGGRTLLEADVRHHVGLAQTALQSASIDVAPAPSQALGTARDHLKAASAQASRLSHGRAAYAAAGPGLR